MEASPDNPLEQAQAEYLADDWAAAWKTLQGVAGPSAEARGLLALCRVRQVLTDFSPEVPVEEAHLRACLAAPFPQPRLEADRAFALGWLAWLAGDYAAAEPHLAESCRQADDSEAAYWLARVRLLLRRPTALADFEQTMRRRPGSPPVTCWYVDLLYRAGQADRAEQVWKTVRTNRRVAAVEEAALLEARGLIRRGEVAQAEHQLKEARPRGGVAQVERQLLLARLLAERAQTEAAERWLQQAEAGPYPPDALRTWRNLFEARRPGGARRAGFVPLDPQAAEPPAGVPPVPWLLHQAAAALGRQGAARALKWLRRALDADPELGAAGARAEVVRGALPELERMARAQALARVARLAPDQPPVPPELLAGAADLLAGHPVGEAVLAAAARDDLSAARHLLAALADRDDLSAPLAQHLALVAHRAALYAEERGQGDLADGCWRLAWRCWLRLLAARTLEERERVCLDRLLDLHRAFINEGLAQDAVAAARRHWGYVDALPSLARTDAPVLAADLAQAGARFRDDLVRDTLTGTLDVMRRGQAAEGWRGDYEAGLTYLRRLLSLDRDNLRLLTALVEICGDWFLDCYNNEDPQTLGRQVERFTPFALKLARLVQDRPQELAARAALAEFYKYRGFIAAGRAEKAALYREAARFNPDNENVRRLLEELEQGSPAAPQAPENS